MTMFRLLLLGFLCVLTVCVLTGCASITPDPDVTHRFVCSKDGTLVAMTIVSGVEGVYVAPVGRCAGDMRIIGFDPGETGT